MVSIFFVQKNSIEGKCDIIILEFFKILIRKKEVTDINWSNGEEFDVIVGSDDKDEFLNYCRIGIS